MDHFPNRLLEVLASQGGPKRVADMALRLESDEVGALLDRAWPESVPDRERNLELARYLALRGANPDRSRALELIESAAGSDWSWVRRPIRALYAQLLVRAGRLTDLREVLARLSLPDHYCWSLETDALNPAIDPDAKPSQWLSSFNSVFEDSNLEPISLADEGGSPFNRLRSTARLGSSTGGPLVSVIMPTHRPSESIEMAVRSILTQTWGDLELIVVDDGSPDEYLPIFRKIEALDSRVRILRLDACGGTYLARNAGLEVACGEFVTFHDDDDWAHPSRIERQVEPLISDLHLTGTHSVAVRAYADLTFTYVGYPPRRVNASSILFRRKKVTDRIGVFDAVRKSGDSEFAERLEAAYPGSLYDLRQPWPLAITQLRAGSLSRSDARPGWLRWMRIAYRDSYRFWHISAGKPVHAPGSVAPTARASGRSGSGKREFPLADPEMRPNRIAGAGCETYDVVLLDDWRSGRVPVSSLSLDIAYDALDLGLRVAIATVEVPFPAARTREPIAPEAQALINQGQVSLIHLSSANATRLLVICNPGTIQFQLGYDVDLRADRTVLVFNPLDGEGDFQYRITDCDNRARMLFGSPPIWVPVGKNARTQFLRANEVSAAHMSIAVADMDLSEKYSLRRGFNRLGSRCRLPVPVVGRHGPDLSSHWPNNSVDLLAVYPDDGRLDVRLFGPIRSALAILGEEKPPAAWAHLDARKTTLAEFLAQLDFFVYFPNPDVSFGRLRPAWEAIFQGCIPVLPPVLKREFGDAAVYCSADDLADTVTELHGDRAAYAERLEVIRKLAAQRVRVGSNLLQALSSVRPIQ